MGATPVEDILKWSDTKLSLWRRDALRRFACNGTLTRADEDELLNAIKDIAKFPQSKPPPILVSLDKTHFASVGGGSSITLKGIRKVSNVNRLAPAAAIDFGSKGLTVIYGRNGSGKSGFVRILRTACRTRIEDKNKLKVLSDVYSSGGGPQEAELVVDRGGDEIIIPWQPGMKAFELLLQVAIFDTGAAQLYVDQGNQIQFLPFGLALPHKLNELCIKLKERLESESSPIAAHLALAAVSFTPARRTAAQTFYANLAATTDDASITAATVFSEDDENRLAQLTQVLAVDDATEVDLRALAKWVTETSTEARKVSDALNDDAIVACEVLKQKAVEARTAASSDANGLFSGEPLEGVGRETWLVLWNAAREFSTTEAYRGREFPVVESDDANCVLCHQSLGINASERLKRFNDFVNGALAKAAAAAEHELAAARQELPSIAFLIGHDWSDRLAQIKRRNAGLSSELEKFKAITLERHALCMDILARGKAAASAPPALNVVETPLASLAKQLVSDADSLVAAGDVEKRTLLLSEREELVDRKVLAGARASIFKRRDLLKEYGCYQRALAEVQTRGITQKANELVDVHLTKAVSDRFDLERAALEISSLKIGLSRKSGQTKAIFQTEVGAKLEKASDILSEGEQRALALAAFFTEVANTNGGGPVVIDDPISSLDRERGLKVAKRLVEEAGSRQVIIFTHDLIFFNDLCREADGHVNVHTVTLFNDGAAAGKVDPSGVSWRGASVEKRLSRIKNDFAPLKKLSATSPTAYELKVKDLYTRLRYCYERMVEELIFHGVVQRGVDRVETQKLRYVHLSDDLALRFHEGMTKANTYSHDNPSSGTVAVSKPEEFEADLEYCKQLAQDLFTERGVTELRRHLMTK